MALVEVSGLARGLPTLQRGSLAVATTVALFPVTFYVARAVGLTVTREGLALVLLGATLLLALHVRNLGASAVVKLDAWEWCGLLVLGLTAITRAAVIAHQNYPAWADSLHHSLLTDLCARQGQLPQSLAPYYPISLRQYHEGLYALTGSFAMLTGWPGYRALAWISQALNALGALGVYFVVDRWAGRAGAVAALIFVGLVSDQPALYVNLGRSTHLAANFLLLFAWGQVVATLLLWTDAAEADTSRARRWAHAGLAGLLVVGVGVLHFRDAIILLLLLVPTVAWMLVGYCRSGASRTRCAAGVAALGVVSLVLALPVLGAVVRIHLLPRLSFIHQAWQASFPLHWPDVYAYAGLLTWQQLSGLKLVGLPLAAGLAALGWRGDRFAAAMGVWVAAVAGFLAVEALHPALDVVNPGFVLIMLYLPAGVVVGAGVNALARRWQLPHRRLQVAMVAVALACLPLNCRVEQPFRFFMTDADFVAMTWIREHTPPSALFAVNTTFWVRGIPHGTDGGYWIPYFTGRDTTAGCMLPGRFSHYTALSDPVVDLQVGQDRVADLARRGVTHLYVGPRGNFAGPGLSVAALQRHPRLRVVYQHEGVTILAITPPATLLSASASLQSTMSAGMGGRR